MFTHFEMCLRIFWVINHPLIFVSYFNLCNLSRKMNEGYISGATYRPLYNLTLISNNKDFCSFVTSSPASDQGRKKGVVFPFFDISGTEILDRNRNGVCQLRTVLDLCLADVSDDLDMGREISEY